jgi:hypothetical protein
MLDRYYVQILDPDIGTPLDGVPTEGNHNGVLDGCNAYAWQRSDGVNVFMCFNNSSGSDHFGTLLRNRIEPDLDAQTNWPSMDVEGFWATPTAGPYSFYGSYDQPHHSFVEAVAEHDDGSSLNLKAGDYTFVGRVTTRLRIRAPLGTARIGD